MESEKMHKQPVKYDRKFLVIAVILGLLIITAGIQAVELAGIKAKLSSGIPTASVSSGATLQKSLDNLPTMVGGC